MLRVGLTGGMGCGKSTVAAMMRELGCQVLDADAVARELVEPGQPALEEIARVFGAEVLDARGRLDRGRLAKIVFQDASKLAKLNAILHPRVIARQEAWLEQMAQREPRSVAVVEAALLIEAGAHKSLDRVVLVWCHPGQQLARLLTEPGRHLSREDAQARLDAQMPLEEKLRAATDSIDNSGTIAQTRAQVGALVDELRALARQQALEGRKP